MVAVVVQPEDDGDAGGRDLRHLGHDAVHEAGGGQVIHQVEEVEGGEVPPVRQGAAAGRHQVVRVQQLVVDEAVCLHPLGELVSLADNRYGLVAALGQERDLE